MGPATKLLCALPRLRELTKSSAGAGSAWAVLMDDDLRYRPWALALLERAIQQLDVKTGRAPNGMEVGALSFDTYSIDEGGTAHPGHHLQGEGMLVGAGARVLALRLDNGLLDGIEDYYQCLKALEPRVMYQDDIWFAIYLHDIKGQVPHRISGTPGQMSSSPRAFPDVHLPTISNRAPGALIAMATANGHRPNGTSTTSEDQSAEDAAAAALYSRQAIVRALAAVRARTLKEGRCGVRPKASWCVGEWCAGAKKMHAKAIAAAEQRAATKAKAAG